MMSALGGGERGTPKADESTDKLRECDRSDAVKKKKKCMKSKEN